MEELNKLGYALSKKEQQIINGGQSRSSCNYFARCLTASDCVSNIPGCNHICDTGFFGFGKAGVCIAI